MDLGQVELLDPKIPRFNSVTASCFHNLNADFPFNKMKRHEHIITYLPANLKVCKAISYKCF